MGYSVTMQQWDATAGSGLSPVGCLLAEQQSLGCFAAYMYDLLEQLEATRTLNAENTVGNTSNLAAQGAV